MLSVYHVTFTVPAPPCYVGDPFPRTSKKERFVVSRDADAARDYVLQSLPIGADPATVVSAYYRPYRPD